MEFLQFDRASGRVYVERDVASKGESPSIRIKPNNLETIEPMSRDLNEVKGLVKEAYRRGDGARGVGLGGPTTGQVRTR